MMGTGFGAWQCLGTFAGLERADAAIFAFSRGGGAGVIGGCTAICAAGGFVQLLNGTIVGSTDVICTTSGSASAPIGTAWLPAATLPIATVGATFVQVDENTLLLVGGQRTDGGSFAVLKAVLDTNRSCAIVGWTMEEIIEWRARRHTLAAYSSTRQQLVFGGGVEILSPEVQQSKVDLWVLPRNDTSFALRSLSMVDLPVVPQESQYHLWAQDLGPGAPAFASGPSVLYLVSGANWWVSGDGLTAWAPLPQWQVPWSDLTYGVFAAPADVLVVPLWSLVSPPTPQAVAFIGLQSTTRRLWSSTPTKCTNPCTTGKNYSALGCLHSPTDATCTPCAQCSPGVSWVASTEDLCGSTSRSALGFTDTYCSLCSPCPVGYFIAAPCDGLRADNVCSLYPAREKLPLSYSVQATVGSTLIAVLLLVAYVLVRDVNSRWEAVMQRRPTRTSSRTTTLVRQDGDRQRQLALVEYERGVASLSVSGALHSSSLLSSAVPVSVAATGPAIVAAAPAAASGSAPMPGGLHCCCRSGRGSHGAGRSAHMLWTCAMLHLSMESAITILSFYTTIASLVATLPLAVLWVTDSGTQIILPTPAAEFSVHVSSFSLVSVGVGLLVILSCSPVVTGVFAALLWRYQLGGPVREARETFSYPVLHSKRRTSLWGLGILSLWHPSLLLLFPLHGVDIPVPVERCIATLSLFSALTLSAPIIGIMCTALTDSTIPLTRWAALPILVIVIESLHIALAFKGHFGTLRSPRRPSDISRRSADAPRRPAERYHEAFGRAWVHTAAVSTGRDADVAADASRVVRQQAEHAGNGDSYVPIDGEAPTQTFVNPMFRVAERPGNILTDIRDPGTTIPAVDNGISASVAAADSIHRAVPHDPGSDVPTTADPRPAVMVDAPRNREGRSPLTASPLISVVSAVQRSPTPLNGSSPELTAAVMPRSALSRDTMVLTTHVSPRRRGVSIDLRRRAGARAYAEIVMSHPGAAGGDVDALRSESRLTPETSTAAATASATGDSAMFGMHDNLQQRASSSRHEERSRPFDVRAAESPTRGQQRAVSRNTSSDDIESPVVMAAPDDGFAAVAPMQLPMTANTHVRPPEAMLARDLQRMRAAAVTPAGVRLADHPGFFRGAPWLLESAIEAVAQPSGLPPQWAQILVVLEAMDAVDHGDGDESDSDMSRSLAGGTTSRSSPGRRSWNGGRRGGGGGVSSAVNSVGDPNAEAHSQSDGHSPRSHASDTAGDAL